MNEVCRLFGIEKLRTTPISLRQIKSRDIIKLWIASLPRPSLSTRKTKTFVCRLPWQYTEAPDTKQPVLPRITLYLDVKFVPGWYRIRKSEWRTARRLRHFRRTWQRGPLQLSLRSEAPCSEAPNATRVTVTGYTLQQRSQRTFSEKRYYDLGLKPKTFKVLHFLFQ